MNARQVTLSCIEGFGVMRPRIWRREYDRLVSQFVKKHFGSWDGVLRLFTLMETPKLTWDDPDSFPADVEFVRKMANEYHGLERHARQYQVTEQYEYAYHHWLMAAYWRRENMKINNFTDQRHRDAVDFDLRCASYNKAMHEWEWDRFCLRKMAPKPYQFGLSAKMLAKKEIIANTEIEKAVAAAVERHSLGSDKVRCRKSPQATGP